MNALEPLRTEELPPPVSSREPIVFVQEPTADTGLGPETGALQRQAQSQKMDWCLMAECSSPQCPGGSCEDELCLSQAPTPDAALVCEGLDQNNCKTKEKQLENVSLEGEAAPETTPEAPSPVCEGPGYMSVQCVRTTSLPVTGSHLSVLKPDPAGEMLCTLEPNMCTFVQNPCTLVDSSAGGPVLVCKRPMQLQPCSMVTTVCRGALGSDGTVPQQFQGPQTAAPEEGSCDGASCYGSHFHHTNLEDTFAAYCHPQPIPAPSQLLPPLIGPEGPTHLSLPRLMSSLSETGLDAKHVSCCCQLGCSWVNVLPQPQRTCPVRVITRDVGTLTVDRGLRDMGVQTEDSSSHVFPQVCLTEEPQREKKKSSQDKDSTQKSPVKEVKWDAEGMTWEVYGASVDPEELGLAIQKHLELQIKETATRAAKLSRQNTNTSRHSGSATCRRKQRVLGALGALGSLRPPACCSRTTTTVD